MLGAPMHESCCCKWPPFMKLHSSIENAAAIRTTPEDAFRFRLAFRVRKTNSKEILRGSMYVLENYCCGFATNVA
jgi:hypothetical protein